MAFLKQQTAICSCSMAASSPDPRRIVREGASPSQFLFLYRFNHRNEVKSILWSKIRSHGYDLDNSCFLTSIGCIPKDYEMSKSFLPHIACRRFNIDKIIREVSPKFIFAEGESLITIVGETNLKTEHFYNRRFLPTYFWSPKYRAWVLPIPRFEDWIDNKTIWINGQKDDSYKSFDNYYQDFFNYQLRKAKRIDATKEEPSKELKTIVLDDPNPFLREHIGKGMRIAVDTETNTLKPVKGSIFVVTTSLDGETGYYMRWKDIDKTLLNEYLKTNIQIYANGAFDVSHFRANGIPDARIDGDCLYAAHFLCSNVGNGLKANTFRYLPFGGYDEELDEFKREHSIDNYEDFPEDLLLKYSVVDACVTYSLEKLIVEKLDETTKKLFFDIFIPYANIIAEIQLEGLPIDIEYLNAYRKECEDKIKAIEDEVGKDPDFKGVNLSSGKQLGLVFKKLGATIINKTETGEISTDEDSLLHWKSEGIKHAHSVLKHKEISKLVSTYLSPTTSKGLVSSLWGGDRVHGQFNLMGTHVLRLSINNSPLQTLPVKSNESFRRIFKAPKDYLYCEADLASCHVRLMASASKDENLVKLFTKDSTFNDVHSLVASKVFTDYSPEEFVKRLKKGEEAEKLILKEHRNNSKKIVFGFLYTMAAATFARNTLLQDESVGGWSQLKITKYIEDKKLEGLRDEISKTFFKKDLNADDVNYRNYLTVATHIRNEFFTLFPGILQYAEDKINFAAEHGYVENLYGFKLYFPELMYSKSENDNKRMSEVRSAVVNYPIISSESITMHLIQREVYEEFKKQKIDGKQVLQIHDSLLLLIHKNHIKESKGIVQSCFEKKRDIYGEVEMAAEGTYSEVWGGHKDFPIEKWF